MEHAPFDNPDPGSRTDAERKELRRGEHAHLGHGLFDEHETRFGETIDPATGRPFSEGEYTGPLEDLEIRTISPGSSEDMLGSLPPDNDEADEWLRQHTKDA